ncbi:MAG TPA: GatB/YqeY domain-containing protein, partial [Gammaproteobacteria bacterium]|nr:GatB/YqeY domain-containing protein [Gammaproteobacteria bacterium]
DADVLAVIDKMIKQRKEAAAQYEAAGRADLHDKESREIEVLQTYLPAQLSASELDALIDRAISESGAASLRDMGKAMAILKREAQGRCDMAAASARLKARLSG